MTARVVDLIRAVHRSSRWFDSSETLWEWRTSGDEGAGWYWQSPVTGCWYRECTAIRRQDYSPFTEVADLRPTCASCGKRWASSFGPDGSMLCEQCRAAEPIDCAATEAGDPEAWAGDAEVGQVYMMGEDGMITAHLATDVDKIDVELNEAIAKARRDGEALRQGYTFNQDAAQLSITIGPAESETVLQEANRLINGDRKQTYEGSDARIAGLWSEYLGITVTELDYCNLMVLMKVARTKGKFHRDSYVDISGYAGLAEKLANAQ